MTVNYPHIRSAAWHAYAGGRIECVKYGHHVGKVYHYDICSAYPSACLALPSFSGRENWQRVCTIKDVFGVWKVSWDYSRRQETPFYPFFYRSPNGSICYPPKGQGWYYTPEVLTALKWMSDSVTIEEGYIWGSNNATVSSQVGGSAYSCESIAQEWPFTFVEQVYQQRKEYKKQGNQAQIALKLGMNSLYGKLAQQTGYGTKTPTYQQIEWAGYITSTTRAKLFDVAMQHPDDVIMFATDGLFSLAEHDVDVGNDLGQWERTTHDELLVAQSGVYWYRDTGEEWTEKYRGFDRGSIQPDMVLGAYERGEWSVAATSSRFVTLGSGLMSSPKLAHWRTWTQGEDAIRTLKLTALGTKRVDVNPWWTEDDNPSMHLFDTTALINEYAELGMESCRYRHKEAMKIEEREEGDGYL